MNKMMKIGIILVVLLSMVGLASASANLNVGPGLDLDTNAGGSVTWDVYVTVTGEGDDDGLVLQTLNFSTKSSEVTGVLVPADATSTALVISTSVSPDGTNGSITWHPTIADTYNFKYTATVTSTPSKLSYSQLLFATGIVVNEKNPSLGISVSVPEFPTIALPVAAILGLAFIFQRRKEEE